MTRMGNDRPRKRLRLWVVVAACTTVLVLAAVAVSVHGRRWRDAWLAQEVQSSDVGDPVAEAVRLARNNPEAGLPRLARAVAAGKLAPLLEQVQDGYDPGLFAELHEDEGVTDSWRQAVRGLGARAHAARPQLYPMLRDAEPAVRVAALYVLAATPDRHPDYVAALLAVIWGDDSVAALIATLSLCEDPLDTASARLAARGTLRHFDFSRAAVSWILNGVTVASSSGPRSFADTAALEALLDDDDASVRRGAAAVLGWRVHPSDDRPIRALLRATAHEREDVCLMALDEIAAHLPVSSAPPLGGSVEVFDFDAADDWEEAPSQEVPLPPDAIPSAIGDTVVAAAASARYRAAAVAVCGHVPLRPVDLERLDALTRDERWEVRIAAGRCLLRSGAELEAVALLCQDGDEDVRREILDEIRAEPVGREALVPAVAELVGDAAPLLRARALATLRAIAVPDQHDAVLLRASLTALRDDDGRAQSEALATLASLGEAAAPALARVAGCLDLGPDDPLAYEPRSDAARALFEMGAVGGGLPLRLEEVGGVDADPDTLRALLDVAATRLAALRALARGGPELAGAAPDVRRCLDDDDPYVREAACEALAELAPVGADVAPAIASRLGDAHWYVRKRAARALGALGVNARGEIERLTAALGDDDSRVRWQVARSLRRLAIDVPEVRAALRVAAKEDASPDVRRAAQEALGELTGRAAG